MNKGFTLSEVLITLGIVGVVAVLTIPGVMKNYKNRLYTAQLEKVYAQISAAIQDIMNDEHVDNFYETTAGTVANGKVSGFGYLADKYLKTLRVNCLTTDSKGCATTNAATYKRMDGGNTAIGAGQYCVQLTSGATICGVHNPNNQCSSLIVDVNGMAEPNIAGRDVFGMDIHKDGTVSDYLSACLDDNKGCNANQCGQITKGDVRDDACGCLNSIIEAGWKMDY